MRKLTLLKVNLRRIMVAACMVLAASGTRSSAAGDSTPPASYPPTIAGSATLARPSIDGYSGTVYIYTGGSFPAFTYPTAFRYLYGVPSPDGKTTGYITPLLFEPETFGQYTVYIVVGIGKGYEVSLNALPQTIPFTILEGVKITPSANYTFGFINALVAPAGNPLAVSEGAVEYALPNVGGDGLGGRGTTNEWMASSSQDTDVALGTTFGVSGSNAANTLFSGYRTYSAFAVGAIVSQ